jgi:putative flippase GtrA
MSESLSIKRVVVVIPALNPGTELIALVHQLRYQGFGRFIIVNDGSDTPYDQVFGQVAEGPAVTVLKHTRNCGKGRALKTAFNYFLTHCHDYYGVVTVDADGQHAPDDIRNVAEILLKAPHTLVLGTRSFARKIPLRSKMGNALTRCIFRFMLGKPISDTQTGLRGIPSSFLTQFTEVPGERYEYETNMLISVFRNGSKTVEMPINTIYINGNRSSHFNPLIDSLLIYFVLFRFIISSAVTSLVDFAFFTAYFYFVGSLPQAIIVGRSCAVGVNFFLNRKFVFKSGKQLFYPLVTYLALVAFIAFVSYLLIQYLHAYFGITILLSKMISELSLFVFSFSVQHNFIFVNREQTIKEDY